MPWMWCERVLREEPRQHNQRRLVTPSANTAWKRHSDIDKGPSGYCWLPSLGNFFPWLGVPPSLECGVLAFPGFLEVCLKAHDLGSANQMYCPGFHSGSDSGGVWVPGVSGWLVVALQAQCWLRLPSPELGSRSSPGSWLALPVTCLQRFPTHTDEDAHQLGLTAGRRIR